MTRKTVRSRLPQAAARRRYIEMGELEVLEKIRRDSQALDDNQIAVGPFARLDAATVAARDGKTRGAITNLFGSQAVFAVETMAFALTEGDWTEAIRYPSPGDFASAEAWIDALFAGESRRGPRHGADPEVSYAFMWALWLSVIPYGIWSGSITRSSTDEFQHWVAKLEQFYDQAINHFAVELRDGVTLRDLACATVNVVEGAWLSQCLVQEHPCDPSQPVDMLLRRAGRMLWHGATRPRGP